MNWKHWLSVGAATFAGGAGTWAAQHLVSGGIPTTWQAIVGFALGASIAGATAIAHLLQQSPNQAGGAS